MHIDLRHTNSGRATKLGQVLKQRIVFIEHRVESLAVYMPHMD